MKRSKLLTIPRAAARMLLATLLLTMTAQTAWAETINVSYLDASGTTQSVDAIPVTGSKLGADGKETWYVVNSDVNLTNCLDISGDVHLILAEGMTLSINNNNTEVPYGLYVCDNSSLTIYSQSLGSNMGKLVIDSHDDFYVGQNSQAIINGGDISVTTQVDAIYIDTGGSMTINNGTVSLTGTNFGVLNDKGSLTINGGTVTITGGAAISSSSTDNYIKNGGTVTLNDTGEGGGEETPDPVTVNYLGASGSELSVDAIPVTFSDPDAQFVLGAYGEETWYVVNSDTTLTQCLFICGDVHLILADGVTLRINNTEDSGVYVGENSSLTIYSQSLGSDMGKLVIDSHDDFYVGENSQAIINGGDISVTTQVYAIYLDTNGSMTINNGTVSLEGINSGVFNDEGTLTINGGTVTITGDPAISSSSTDNYIKNGGTVTLKKTGEVTVNYLDASGSELSVDAIPVTFSDPDVQFVLGAYGEETWYVVNSDVVLPQCLNINGDVHLILADGKTLSINNTEDYGVYVCEGSSLTIYSQSQGSNMGKLVINSNWSFSILANSKVIINGGNISVTTQVDVIDIGTGSSMTINNGTVSLEGKDAGVDNDEGTLTINGGTVTFDCQISISNVANYTHKGGTVTLDCMVTFDSNGGSAVSDVSVVRGQPVAEPASPTRDGYVFDGWMNGTSKYDFSYCIDNDLELTAQWKKLMTNKDITVSIPSQEWTGSELTFDPSAVVVKDGETTLTQTTDYTVTAPSGTIRDAGDYAFTITGAGNYSGEATATFTITPKPVTVKNSANEDVPAATGDATITQDQTGVTLKLIAPAENVEPQTVSIPTEVEVDHVNIERSFTSGKASTVYLPFSIPAANVSGGKFHTFTDVDETTTPWTVNYTVVTGDIEANTPYIFLPDGKNDGKIVVDNGSNKISVCTANPQTTTQGKWEFIGTYDYIQWLLGNSRADEIGLVYGFAAQDLTVGTTNYEVGQFVKIGSGAFINPMRAYLKRSATAGARTLSRGDAESLPETMTVVLKGANGETTNIGTIGLDNETGEWYSLDGRRLSGKQATKGLYIRSTSGRLQGKNNGKKVIIK